MKSLFARLFLSLVAIAGISACNSTPLVMPTPVMYSQPGPNMRDVIVKAMTRRTPGWRIVEEDEEAGRMRAEIINRKHTAVIDVIYDGTEVTFHHVSSTNLKETRSDDGEIKIHKAYNNWLINLRNDIQDELRLAKM